MKQDRPAKGTCAGRLLLALLLAGTMLLPCAGPPPLAAMDLIEAYAKAREHDPLFGSASYEREATKTFSQQGWSLLLPQIQAGGTLSRFDFETAPAFYLDYTSQYMGITLRQPLFSLPKYHEYRQQTIRESIGEVRFVSAGQDLILRLAEAYFNALATENIVEATETEKKTVAEQIEQARRMFQAGAGTITDVHNAQARYDAVLAQEIEAKNQLDMKKRALKKILGEEPGSLNVLRDDLPLEAPVPATLADWIEIAKEHHPLLKSYAYQVQYQERELEKNKGQHWPSVDLTAGYATTNTNNLVKTQDTTYSSVGIQVTVPLFSGGYTSAKVAESRAFLGRAQKEYENALADTVQKLSEAFYGILAGMAKISALEAAVKSADTALHSNKMGLLAGVKTTVDVLNAQRELHDVTIRLLRARYDYLLFRVRLKLSAGTLAEEDLHAINQWLCARQAR
jgi:TolC family type I secretion outer membrane protein